MGDDHPSSPLPVQPELPPLRDGALYSDAVKTPKCHHQKPSKSPAMRLLSDLEKKTVSGKRKRKTVQPPVPEAEEIPTVSSVTPCAPSSSKGKRKHSHAPKNPKTLKFSTPGGFKGCSLVAEIVLENSRRAESENNSQHNISTPGNTPSNKNTQHKQLQSVAQEAERSQEGIQSSPPTPLAEIEPAEDYTQVRKDLTKNLHPPKVKPKI